MQQRLWQIAAELDSLAGALQAAGATLEAARIWLVVRELRALAGRLSGSGALPRA